MVFGGGKYRFGVSHTSTFPFLPSGSPVPLRHVQGVGPRRKLFIEAGSSDVPTDDDTSFFIGRMRRVWREAQFRGTRVTYDGLENLKGLTNLTVLSIEKTSASNTNLFAGVRF